MKKFSFLMMLVLGFAVNALALNPYAYGVSVTNDGAGNATVNYSLNAAATSAAVVFYNGETEAATVALTDLTAGAHTATVALPTEAGTYTVKIRVNGTSVTAPTQESTMYNFYCPHGVAIDKDPASANFGRLLITEAMQSVATKTSYVSAGKGAGIYAFTPAFTTDSVRYTGGNTFTEKMTNGTTSAYAPFRVRISDDGRIFATAKDNKGVVVWELSNDLQTWTPVVAGNQDTTTLRAINADSTFYCQANVGFDVKGSGADLKLLLYSCNNSGIAFNQSGFRLDEYALGTATSFVGTPTHIAALDGAYAVNSDNAQVIYDGEGGYWFGASRAGNAGQPNLAHINAQGVCDYYDISATLYGGDGILVYKGMLFKGKARTNSTTGNFEIYTIGKNANDSVTLTSLYKVTGTGIGRNFNDFAVDYADNLYTCGNSNEKLIAYALPYSGVVETPVAGYSYKVVAPITEDLYIEFAPNSTSSDNSNSYAKTAAIASVFKQGASYIASIDSTANVFAGRNSLPDSAGVKFGSSSKYGYISLTLDGTIDAKAIVVISAGYGDSEYGNFSVNGTEISHTAAKALNKVWQYDTIQVSGVISTIDIHQLTAAKGRFYLKGIKVLYNAPEPEPAADIIWSEYLGDGASGGAQTYANQYKYGHTADQTSINYVNIQKPGFATADGIYLTAPAAISSCSLAGYDVQGGGILVHLSNFTAKTTEFTITCVDGQTYTCYIWNENGTDTPTALDEIESEKAVKFFQNGQIYIRKGDAVYTISGLRIE